MYELSAITGKPSDEARSSTKFFRAPLLWILCPQITAYVLCECGFSLAPTATLIASGTAFLCAFISVTVAFLGKGEKESVCNDLWTFFLPVAVFFLAGAWWSCQAPKFVNWSGKPETEVVIDAEIETPFRSSGKSWSGLARVLTASEGGESLCGARIFYQFSKSETNTTPSEGMRIHLRGIAQDIASDSWLNADFRDFLLSRRTGVRVGNGDCIRIVNPGLWDKTSAWFARQKSKLIQKLVDPKSTQEREQRILTAMLLGERSLLPQEQREDFMLTGTMHIFAVSGLHVSLFAALLFGIFSRVRLPYWSIAVTTILISGFYVLLTGAAPSAVRAWTMIVFLLAARLVGRSSNPLNALVLAATLTLWHNSSLLASLGFQLSYGVVASIFLYGIPLSDACSRIRILAYIPEADRTRTQRMIVAAWEKGIGLFVISFGTFVAGSAFLAGTFEIFTPIAILVNLILVPYVGMLLGTAIAAAVLFGIPGTTWLAELIWQLNCLLMFGVEVLTGTAAEFPFEFAISFPFPWLGTLGGTLVFLLFTAGAFWAPLRSRPYLRFTLPPLFLCLYLLAFTA